MINTMTTTYTADDARREYPPKLRRWAVFQMAQKFGYSEYAVKTLVTGPGAALRPKKFSGQTNGYFDRDEVLKEIL